MLEGTLDTFTLPDIFQLLAFTKKTGCLHMDRDGASGRVWFKEGEVFYAVASSGRLMLGKRLVGAGQISTDQVKEALQEQKDRQGTRLGRILLEMGAVDEDTLKTFIREQIQDSIFDLMRWSDGSFRFEHPIDTDEAIGLSVSTENLIMEGSRRLEEWDTVRKKIPGRDAIVDMAPAPGDSGVEVNLEPEEWRLLALVDGTRTVGELVELSGQGEFMTCKLLYGMVGAGLLEVRDPDMPGPSSVAALLEQQELLRRLEEEDDAPSAAAAPEADTDGAPEPEAAAEPEGEAEEDAGDVDVEPIGPQEESPEVAGEDAVEVPDDEDLEPAPDEIAAAETAADEAASEEVAADEATDDTAADEAAADETATDETADEEDEVPEPEDPVADAEPAKHEQVQRAPDKRLTTDPTVDPDLLDRLIEGVKGL